ncbi:quinone-dependent dihydroorotate dehydrogenase [Leptothoe spongobia]|uniref:Dihydroorotate dehydrogenase (quinone) n=1 Tax=Leptothoe spongobia TAU-MAC 1115 TaxID=1967444 RepID=A0A947GIT8_9CYAN|nr:quinone-dependent dihydroorotate dehydrogenase [Leptothoe spongobia]MBT9316495.1 quinone-dependent dihydroorotate dehydrogenase [Leptothoe spongobia TAU-MAC 1115]
MLQDIYKYSLLPLLFQRLGADPETVHQQTLLALDWIAQPPITAPYWSQPARRFAQAWCENSCQITSPRLSQTLWHQTFTNPLGLAAGFDKDGVAAGCWPLMGFGFAELGTVTCHAQPGNPKPRLFRLPQDQAALNRMGFNNQGSAALAERLSHLSMAVDFPRGINLGKSKVTPLEDAANDYLQSFQRLQDLGSYFVVNVSSPNTPGLRSLQAKSQLEPILAILQTANIQSKPLLIKIAPDLAWKDIDDILDLAQQYHLAGIIATNTTIAKEQLLTKQLDATGNLVTEEAGGISGAPVRQRATEVVRYIYQKTHGQLPIIGVGGIFTADDAWDKITAGASLLQVYTGWVYEGPWMVKNVLQGLLDKLDTHGLNNIQEAIGLNTEQPNT